MSQCHRPHYRLLYMTDDYFRKSQDSPLAPPIKMLSSASHQVCCVRVYLNTPWLVSDNHVFLFLCGWDCKLHLTKCDRDVSGQSLSAVYHWSPYNSFIWNKYGLHKRVLYTPDKCKRLIYWSPLFLLSLTKYFKKIRRGYNKTTYKISYMDWNTLQCRYINTLKPCPHG